jgi:hypothetical protein
MVQLWQPVFDRLLETYTEFIAGKSDCNVFLLTTDHDYFSEFRKHFLEPKFGRKMEWFNVMSGRYFEINAKNMDEEVLFLSDMVGSITDKNADKAQRVRSLKKLITTAIKYKKFLILSGYDFMLPRFYEYLKLAYINIEIPQIREDRLKTPERAVL